MVLFTWARQLQTERQSAMDNILRFPLGLNVEPEGRLIRQLELTECTLEIIGLCNPVDDEEGRIDQLIDSCAAS